MANATHRIEAILDDAFTALGMGDGVVVGVSGGPDSLALMYALLARARATGAPERLVAAHFDHGLRGDASTADAELVRAAAERAGIEAVVERADVRARARDLRANLEATARELRYEFLGRTALDRGIGLVATAHTADDQAETVLMRLARGAAVDGLVGIHPRRTLRAGVDLVRPLLEARRADVLAYCRARDIEYADDATNRDTDLARAFVRHEILPLLERASPGAAANIARTAARAREDADFFAPAVAPLLARWGVAPGASPARLPADELTALPAALRRRAIREAIRAVRGDLRRVDAGHLRAVERLADEGAEGRGASLPADLRAYRRGTSIVLEIAETIPVAKVDTRS